MLRVSLIALALASAALTLPAAAQTVKVTPLGSIDGEFCPQDRALVFEDPNGKGKVITLVPGHLGENPKYPTTYDCVGFRTVLQRATEWVATDKVTIPVPKNFPTPDQISTVPQTVAK